MAGRFVEKRDPMDIARAIGPGGSAWIRVSNVYAQAIVNMLAKERGAVFELMRDGNGYRFYRLAWPPRLAVRSPRARAFFRRLAAGCAAWRASR